MTSTPARDFEPPDEVSDWIILAVGELLTARLEGQPYTARLVGATSHPADAYQLLAVLARNAGLILRPGGYTGGPFGDAVALATLQAAGRDTSSAIRSARAATQLLAAGARGDADMVRALALAVVGDGRSNEPPRDVARAMLEVFAREPRIPTPQGDPE